MSETPYFVVFSVFRGPPPKFRAGGGGNLHHLNLGGMGRQGTGVEMLLQKPHFTAFVNSANPYLGGPS